MRARQTSWTDEHGEYHTGVVLGNKGPDGASWINLPCGKCIGCRFANAQAWALRCQLELQQHRSAVFTTLTYDADHVPPTLQKRDLQLWLKRLRKAGTLKRPETKGPLRFFACGEYGEQNKRPHYHAIVYGLDPSHALLIDQKWGLGHTMTAAATPATIAYTAGYTAKKISDTWNAVKHQRVDPSTGEVYTWQPPFTQMSRRPGIGGHARQWTASWRLYAVNNGHKMPVPRFLHEAWKAQATTEQLEELQKIREQIANETNRNPARLNDALQIAEARQAASRNRRKL